MKKLLIQGLDEGAGPGDIVGAITGEAEIAGELIGNIEIRDNYATAEIDSNVADLVIEKMNNDTIGGDRVSVRPFREDDPERLERVADYIEELSGRLREHRREHDAAVEQAEAHDFVVDALEEEPASTFLLEPADGTPHHHGLRAGDAVTVVQDGTEHRSRLLRAEDGTIIVRVGGGLHEPLGDRVQVRPRQDPLAFNRMQHAIAQMEHVNGEIEALRDRIAGIEGIRATEPLAVDAGDRLDEDQQQAVGTALAAEDLALIQAPPGTGGGRVVAETAARSAEQGHEVLLAAAPGRLPTQLRELQEAGAEPVCIANTHALPDEVKELSLRRKAAETDPWQEVEELREALDRHYAEQQGIDAAFDPDQVDTDAVREAAARGEAHGDRSQEETAAIARWLELQDHIEDHEHRIDRHERRAYEIVLRNADVVCASAIDAGWPLLSQIDFDTVVVEDADRLGEPLTLVPLQHGDRAVLVGDQRQHPAAGIGWDSSDRSLFGRLCERSPDAVQQLRHQYRTHPDIMAYPDGRWYDGQLQADASVVDQLGAVFDSVTGLNGALAPEYPLALLAADGPDAVLEKTADSIDRFRDAGIDSENIGVIAPDTDTAVRMEDRIEPERVVTIGKAREQDWGVVIIPIPDPAGIDDERWLSTAMMRARAKCLLVGDRDRIEERFPGLSDHLR